MIKECLKIIAAAVAMGVPIAILIGILLYAIRVFMIICFTFNWI